MTFLSFLFKGKKAYLYLFIWGNLAVKILASQEGLCEVQRFFRLKEQESRVAALLPLVAVSQLKAKPTPPASMNE